MDNNERTSFTLSELLSADETIKIPAVQRGSVWNARQVEFLWDSILRGFPVGAFIVRRNGDGYDLLDGQQRYNAIRLAAAAGERAKLWLDLEPELPANSSRKFLVKATTAAHPWGYKNDDACSLLSAEERREALRRAGYAEGTSIANTPIGLMKPYMAKRPIPLPTVIAAALSYETEDAFAEAVVNQLDFEGDPNQVKDQLRLFYRVTASNLRRMQIPLSFVDDRVFEKDDDLETLFRRITAGGTQITQSELAYSAIKVCFDGEDGKCVVKKACEDASFCAQGMSDYLLALTTIRLYLLCGTEGWVGSVSINRIKSLAKNTADRDGVLALFKRLPGIVRRTESVFGACEIPAVMRADVAQKATDLYLLMMWLVDQHDEFVDANARYLVALVFYLKWFTSGGFGAFAKRIYTQCRDDISIAAIESAVYDESIAGGNLIPICTPEEFEKIVDPSKFNADWTAAVCERNRFAGLWQTVTGDSRGTPDFLLYAERNYFNRVFINYAPSIKDVWSEHNRPWDYDHIVPQNWFYNRKSGKWRNFCNQLYCRAGNFAAIPFEENRSKNGGGNWGYYEENADGLMFDRRVEQLTPDIVYDEKQALLFAEITLTRCAKIYEQIYSLLRPLFHAPATELSLVAQRKSVFVRVMATIGAEVETKICFAEGSAIDRESNIDWSAPVLNCEMDIGMDGMVLVLSYERQRLYLGICDKGTVADAARSLPDGIKQLFSVNHIDGRWYVWSQINDTDIYNRDAVQRTVAETIGRVKEAGVQRFCHTDT